MGLPCHTAWLAADQLRYFYLFFLLLSYLNYIFSFPLLFFPFFTIQMPSLDESGAFFSPVLTSPGVGDSSCFWPLEAAIWALITSLTAQRAPVAALKGKLKRF